MKFTLTFEQSVLAAAALGALAVVFFSPSLILRYLKMIKLLRKKGKGIKLGRNHIEDQSRLRHTHIVGATGTGKTVLLEKLIEEDLKRGFGALIIDPKGEREFYESVKNLCGWLGREKDLKLLSASFADESASWNPCVLGSSSEVQTKFFNSAIYNEPHYAKACEYGLLRAIESLKSKKSQFYLNDLTQELEKISRAEKDQTLQGLFYDLNNLLYGEWGSLLTPQNRTDTISLLDIVKNNQILFVDLPTEGKRVQSSRIGRLLTQEIVLISGMRKRDSSLKGGHPFSVFIDEFDAFATESFASFLNKGRSSEFMIHLAHQTLSDLNVISPEFAGQILGNCNVRFIFRQDDPDDAETWARFIGTKATVKETIKVQDGRRTGDASLRETQEFVVSPDRIKSLAVGQCVLSIKTQGVNRTIQVPFRNQAKTKKKPKQNKLTHFEAPQKEVAQIEVPQSQPPQIEHSQKDKAHGWDHVLSLVNHKQGVKT